MREKKQFAVLYRDFLSRVVDPDLLSIAGDQSNLLGQFAAVLAAFSFVLCIYVVQQFRLAGLHREALLIAAWQDEEFFFANTLAVAGMLGVVAWNNILPDRRESLILAPLPLRARTIFLAKAAAIATALGVALIAVNVFTGVVFPFLVIPTGLGWFGPLRSLTAYWLTAALAGVFIFSTLLAIQGFSVILLGCRRAQKASGALQLLAFFAILSVYFLTPPLATPARLASPGNQTALAWLPSFWFLGLFHGLAGSPYPVLKPLATRAELNTLAAALLATGVWGFAYRRTMRRLIELPDIAPSDRNRLLSRSGALCVSVFVRNPLDRAVLMFTARGLTRSRQHRLMLAVYGGIALAISLAYAKEVLYGSSREQLHRASLPVLIATFVPLVLAVVGTRAVFALPLALRANWIFQVTSTSAPQAYFAAVRKSLLLLTALPVCMLAALLCAWVWPGTQAAMHLTLLVLVATLLTLILLRNFRKIPFACSYLPGKSNLKIRLGAFSALFLLAVDLSARLELWSLQQTERFMKLTAVIVLAVGWAWWRIREGASSAQGTLQFEDVPDKDIHALDLRGPA